MFTAVMAGLILAATTVETMELYAFMESAYGMSPHLSNTMVIRTALLLHRSHGMARHQVMDGHKLPGSAYEGQHRTVLGDGHRTV